MRVQRKSRTSHRSASGQALAEAVIGLALLVPLLLLIPMLGKYAHIEQATQQAARNAAWEATVVADYDDNRLNTERADQQSLIIDRHFGDADAVITSAPAAVVEDATHLGDPMLNTFSNRPLVRREDIQLAPYGSEDAGGMMAGAMDYLPDEGVLPGSFPPEDDINLTIAKLTVNAQNLRTTDGEAGHYLEPFDRIDLSFESSHTLLADSWNAKGSGIGSTTGGDHPRTVYQQVRTLAWGTNLAPIGDAFEQLEFLEFVPLLGQIFKLRLGYAQDVMDVVPNDRLEDYPEP